MPTSRPLIVAVIAMALLLVSVGFEVAVHRSYSVDVQNGGGWQTVGRSATAGTPARPLGVVDPVPIHPNDANDSVTFRVRVDNGYPWAYSEHYYVQATGVTIAEGDLHASARSTGESTFTIPTKTLLARFGTPQPLDKGGGTTSNITGVYMDVDIGRVYINANFQMEASS